MGLRRTDAARWFSSKEIAGELATTERTVKFHRAHLLKKMQAETLAELVRMAGRLGIAPPGEAGPAPTDG